VLLAAGAFGAAGAQSPREVRVEAGAAQVRQLGRNARAAAVLGGFWRENDPRFASVLSSSLTFARDSIAALQGIAAMAWRPTIETRWQTEGGAAGAVFGVSELGRGGNYNFYLRERAQIGDGGAWLGAANGNSIRDQVNSRSTAVDLGGWMKFGDATVSLSRSRIRSSDWLLLEAAGVFLSREAAAYDIDDNVLAVHYTSGRLSIDGSQTFRGGAKATRASQSALYGTVAWEFSDRVGLALSTGRQLADPVRGTPDATFSSAIVRLSWRTARDADVITGAFATARLVTEADGATLYLHVSAPESVMVTIAGTFSAWEPVTLSRAADGWDARVRLKPGQHRVAVRFDDGPWRSPANLARMKDEFGGESGLIIVP